MANKKALISIALMIILCLPLMMQVSHTTVRAADVPVYLKVWASPNPVGLGQTEFLSLFFTKPIPNVAGQYYTGLKMNVVKPDGTNDTLGPFTADTTGGVGGIKYVPTVVGNYTIQAFYPGQTINTGDKLLPTMSAPDTFTVQQQLATSYSSPPLPTEYWSRPIYATNYNWAQLGGNWWGLGKPSFTDTGGYDAQGNNFNPYTQAPNSGHIMWVKPTAFGGQVGLPISGDQESQYTSTSILYRQFEPIILNGIIYYKLYPNVPTTVTSPGGTPGWAAVDLRTGKTVWTKDTNDPLVFGMDMQFHTVQEYGTQTFLVAIGPTQSVTVSNVTSTYSTWQLFDPMTGYFIANITSVPNTVASGLVETRDANSQGAVYIHTITSGNLTMWNSTLCLQGPPSSLNIGGGYSSTIRPSGNINYTRGLQWSVPVVTTLNGGTINPALSISGRTNDAILMRSYPAEVSTFATEFGADHCVEAAYSATTGDLLWGPVNRTLPKYHEVSMLAIGDGYYVEHDKDTNQAYGYSLTTGQQLWGPVTLVGSSLSTLERGGAIAYGNVYIWDFGGYVNAINLQTGAINWTYVPPSVGYSNPYGTNPIWHFGSHSIADGKIFLSQSRMYDPPLFPGANKLAINCTDGSLVWSELGFYGREPSAIADGYLVGWNSYDCQIYTWGKGQTDITANIQNNIMKSGDSVLIQGTVTDQSPGTKDSDRAARFPNGVPAVSDASMSKFMEYVYMQQPKPTNTTGVPVIISVLDSNGNYRQIGTTTSDAAGFYSFEWTPDITGKYTVTAAFAGSESYWPTSVETSFAVDSAAVTASPIPAVVLPPTEMYIAAGVIAIIIAIAIVGVVLLMAIRKRP